MKRIYVMSIICAVLLSSCSQNNADYELRLVENDNKFTINPSPTVSVSNIVDNSSTIEVGANETTEFFIPDYNEGLDDSIVVEEDIVKADIEEQKDELLVEDVVDDDVVEDDIDDVVDDVVDEVVDDEVEAEEVSTTQTVVTVVTTDTTDTTDTIVDEDDSKEDGKEEFVFEPIILNECVYSQAEHTFSQTLINYVGKGNYEKWIANAKPTCENGLTIYDYMNNFNMTKGFFVNLTAYDPTYANVNVYAH